MPVFHTFTAGGKRYMFDANTNVIINLKEDLYFELEKYMQSGYKEITPAIEKLRDRGYLKDRADFEMVHPMDSTLEYSLERCIGTIALQVTQGCNLRCKYCAYSGSYDNRVHSSKRMSKEIAFKAIDFLFDHSIDRDRVSLGFYGGEPLLELDLIKECVKYAKKKSIGKELMFNITSNTTLITDEVLKFLYDNEFSLTVSLDGDRQAHDKNRVFAANGAGTFSVVMQILEKIQTQYPDYMERVHINAVIDPTTDFDCKDTKVQEYCDDGFTGTKFERPGYMKLMEDIRAEKISCIVVKDLSRLGRDYIEVGSLLEQILPLYQVRVIAVNDNYDSNNYDGSTGGMNVAFKNLIYMLYSRDLSNKICSAKHTRILNGENISGQLRYGYVKDPSDKHKIIVDPEAAEVVKLIFELTAQGKRKTEVANYLNAHGIDTPSAYKKKKGSKNFFHAVEVKSLWSTSSIHDILNDEVYLGKLIWNKTKKRVGSNNTSTYVPKDEWIVIENCHEPIITQKLFDTAHANSKKYIRPKRGKRNYNPFYYCGVCGRALVPSKRVKGDILLCSSSRIEENSPCKSNRVEITKVEDTIMKIVNMYATAYLDEKGIKKAGKSKEVSPEEKIATLEKKVKSLSSKKMMLYSDYKDDKLTREEYVKRSKAMVEQIDELHQEIEQLKTEIPPEDNSSSKFETQLESIINMESFDREKIQKVIKKVIINGEDNIEIVWNTDDPFFK